MADFPAYDYEQIFIDNASTDDTVTRIKSLATEDRRLRPYSLSRPCHPSGPGDAVIGMASDLQDPPELMGEFIKAWEKGHKVVVAVNPQSRDTLLMEA